MTFDELPDVVIASEVAEFMRLQTKSIYNSLSNGTFLPLPFDSKPFRWRKEDLGRWRDGEFKDAIRKLRAQARKRRESEGSLRKAG